MKLGKELIAEERTRQITKEGFSRYDDANLRNGELSKAARAYEAAATLWVLSGRVSEKLPNDWPFLSSWWKPNGGPVRLLIKAGALYQAEIDRLDFNNQRGIVEYTDALLAVKRCASGIDFLRFGRGEMISTRIWPLGTKLSGKIHEVYPGKEPQTPQFTFVVAEGEGYLLSRTTHDVAPSVGMNIVMEFMKGGPTGGYWKIVDFLPAEAA